MTLVDAPPTLPNHDDDDHGDTRPYVVIGGGPAGLSAGVPAREGRRKVIVFEAEDQVGGLAEDGRLI